MQRDWTSDSFRSVLAAMVRRHVPDRDAEDVVQAVLCEALSSPHRPDAPEAARKWIWGVTRHKIADYHRHAHREVLSVHSDAPDEAGSEEALSDMLRWAVGELPPGADASKTFAWLLREAEGETLEEIADHERLPAAQVRKRVSRLRQHFRSRYTVYAALGLIAVALYLTTRRDGEQPHVPRVGPAPEVQTAVLRGRAVRADALTDCARHDWAACLQGLDAARALDPVGDAVPSVQTVRQQALDALHPHVVVPLGDAGVVAPPHVVAHGGSTRSTVLPPSSLLSPDGSVPTHRSRYYGPASTSGSSM